MSRTIVAAVRSGLEASHGADEPRVFVQLRHSQLTNPIQVVNAAATQNGVPVNYSWSPSGLTMTSAIWQAFPFSIELLSDDDGAPRGRLEIANINRIPGQGVQSISGTPLSMVIYVVPVSAFDLTVNPRVPLVLPVVAAYTALGLHLSNVQVDAMSVTGDIYSLDDTSEPFPSTRAIANILPGLFIG